MARFLGRADAGILVPVRLLLQTRTIYIGESNHSPSRFRLANRCDLPSYSNVYGKPAHGPGNESEMIFGYAYLSLALEDLLSNIITYNYLMLTSYLPPFLTGSISDYQIGGQAIIDSQHGYHEQFSGMTAIHHVFFWRYYAGAAFVIYAYFLAKTTRRALIKFESTAVIVASLLMLIGTGAAIHWVVKFRPYLSVPLLTYRTTTGLLAVSLLL